MLYIGHQHLDVSPLVISEHNCESSSPMMIFSASKIFCFLVGGSSTLAVISTQGESIETSPLIGAELY